MKVALPIWEGRVSPVFDTAGRLLVARIEAGEIESRREESIAAPSAAGRVSRLRELEVEVLICGAISRPLGDLVSAAGIRLVPFVTGAVDEILKAFVSGTLDGPAYLMPGCCGMRRRCGGGRGHRRMRGGRL